ncbi:YtxH domain-containing protein [Bacillus ginsengihumi]|uniref:YtxH domain-containing protein n=1 Tax=Heyndrickxia ginsengihumi TaxID=363870 RepID=A0A6M0P9Q1_9BACI|nr:YtxH domain-containing protein [Heyndrickxia ginsengihumi]NEY21536.1 YtxH domain-containing protein [Heyndrickxia ginsengihumi]
MANSSQEVEEKRGSKDFVTGALIGSFVGAAVALLLAPKSGKELREDIGEQVSTIRGKADGWRELASEKGNIIVSTANEKSKQVRNLAVEKGEQLRVKGAQIKENVKLKAQQFSKKSSNEVGMEEGVSSEEADTVVE